MNLSELKRFIAKNPRQEMFDSAIASAGIPSSQTNDDEHAARAQISPYNEYYPGHIACPRFGG